MLERAGSESRKPARANIQRHSANGVVTRHWPANIQHRPSNITYRPQSPYPNRSTFMYGRSTSGTVTDPSGCW